MKRQAKASFAGSNSGAGAALSRWAQRLIVATAIAGFAFALTATFALAAEKREFSLSIGSAGSGDGQFELAEHSGVAVNESTHDVYVADTGNHRIDQFSSSGAFIRAFGADVGGAGVDVCTSSCVAGTVGSGPGEFEAPTFIAIDNSPGGEGDVYVADTANNLVSKFEADGTLISSWGTGGQLDGSSATDGPFGELAGIAVDSSGQLLVYQSAFAGFLFKFEQDGTFVTDFTTERGTAPAGLAVDPDGNFFKVNGSPNIEKFKASGADIGQVSIPETATGLAVDSSSGVLFIDNGASIEEYAFGPSGEVIGFGCVPAPFEGCPPTGGFGDGDLTAAGGLAVDGASNVVYAADPGAGRVAVFANVIFPDATTESATGLVNSSAVLHGAINAAGGPQATCFFEYVGAEAKGFEGATSVPCSPSGPFTGTSPTAVEAKLSGLSEGFYRFRLVASNVNGSTEGKSQTFSLGEGSLGLPDGRVYEMVSPPAKAGEVFPPETEGRLVGSCGGECLPGSDSVKMPMQPSPDGNAIVYEGQQFTADTASGPNEYLARRTASGWGTEGLSLPQYRTGLNFQDQGQGFRAFSSDLSRAVIVQVKPSLAPEAPADYANIYLWQPGAALLPAITSPPPHRSPGDNEGTSFDLVYGGANAGSASAAPFSHVIFAANDALTEEAPGIAPEAPEVEADEENLYEWANGQLSLVNVLPGNLAAAPDAVIGSGHLLEENPSNEGPVFDRAISTDGSKIFWTDKASGQVYVRIDGEETREIPDLGGFLTASAEGSKVLLSNGHIYDLATETTTDLTAAQGGFEGTLGAAADLSRVYFVDTAALTGGEENANGEQAEAGADNLYAWDQGSTVFIARLRSRDNDFGALGVIGAWKPSPSYRTAQVSPDGRYLAFMSSTKLTGYDNNQAESKVCGGVEPACSEVFEYDAASATLSCASCNPTGERPLGYSNLSLISNGAFSTFIPQPGNLTAAGQGRLFFESQDTLSPRDTNGHIQDVYEWEPNGVGNCHRAAGCVSLISAGNEPYDSLFLNATPSGNDAFFVTRDQLALADRDDFLDLYDARINGGVAAETETIRSECQGESCQPAAFVPNDPTPSSSAFQGVGNVKAGHKHHRKKHKRHAKRQGHRRAANSNRGGAK